MTENLKHASFVTYTPFCALVVHPIIGRVARGTKLNIQSTNPTKQLVGVGDLHVQSRLVIIPKVGFFELNLKQFTA